jgi:hypothetical protein
MSQQRPHGRYNHVVIIVVSCWLLCVWCSCLVFCMCCYFCHFYVRHHLVRGLRCPSEPSTKLLASWWLVCSNSDENLDQMDETTKRLMMSHVKSSWDSRRRFSVDPPEWLDTLPGAPLQLLQQYPDTFRVAFGSSSEGGPIPYPMDLTKLLAFDQTYGCRGGVRHVPAAVAGPRRVLARQPSETGPAERMANVFMSRMENIFSAMMNSGANSGGPCMGRGLSALASSSDLTRRMPTINFGQPVGEHLALPAPMLQVPSPAAFLQPGTVAPPQPSLQPSVSALSLQLAVAAASDSPEYEASDELANMLDMLSAREVAKKTAAKAAAIAAKAAPASESDVAPVAAAAAPKAKAPANVKAAAPKVKAAAATVKAAAAAVKAATAKAPPAAAAKAAKAAPAAKVKAAAAKAPPAPPKAAAKAKAKAEAKAAGAVAAVLGDGIKLGCPKCRSALSICSSVFSKCFQMFSKCFQMFFSVLHMFPTCSPNVLHMFFSVLQLFFQMFFNVFLPRRVHKVDGTRWFCGESFVLSYHNARSHTADHNARSHTADHNARSHTAGHNARSQTSDHNTRSVSI